MMAAAVLMSGQHYAKVSLLFKTVGICFLSETTLYNIQPNVLCPGLERLWKAHQVAAISKMPSKAVLCGDGRCDSPGHSAKLLVYPIMDHSSGLIYHLQFCDKRQVSDQFPTTLRGHFPRVQNDQSYA